MTVDGHPSGNEPREEIETLFGCRRKSISTIGNGKAEEGLGRAPSGAGK